MNMSLNIELCKILWVWRYACNDIWQCTSYWCEKYGFLLLFNINLDISAHVYFFQFELILYPRLLSTGNQLCSTPKVPTIAQRSRVLQKLLHSFSTHQIGTQYFLYSFYFLLPVINLAQTFAIFGEKISLSEDKLCLLHI